MQFLKANIWQGSVVTLFRCDEFCNKLFIANFLLSVTVKIFRESMNKSLGFTFLAHPVYRVQTQFQEFLKDILQLDPKQKKLMAN